MNFSLRHTTKKHTNIYNPLAAWEPPPPPHPSGTLDPPPTHTRNKARGLSVHASFTQPTVASTSARVINQIPTPTPLFVCRLVTQLGLLVKNQSASALTYDHDVIELIFT